MSGLNLFNKFNNYRPDTKILYIPDCPDEVLAKHGIAGTGVNFLKKSLGIEIISNKVRKVSDEKE